MPEERRRPAVLAGGSQFVQDQVARACAAAGVTPVFVAEPAETLALDPVVLLIAPGRQAGRIAGSREVVVVGAVEEESQVWATAAELPMAGSVAVLSHAVRPDLGGVAPEDGTAAAGVVLEAARGAFTTSVLDLACGGTAVRELVSACDRIVLLVPARPRGITAARRLLQVWSAVPATVVLRGPVLDGMDGWTAADLLGRPAPLACLPFVRGAALAEADGRVLEDTPPRSVRRIVAAVLDGVGGTTP